MKLDFLICGSATESFYSQIAFFRLCLDRLGGHYRTARLVAVFGDQNPPEISDRWLEVYKRIDVIWANEAGAPNPAYKLQHEMRFDVIREDADFAFLCDADVALLAPFDDLLQELLTKPALVGAIAHYHFPWSGRESSPDIDWPEISLAVIGREIPRPFQYTLYENIPPQKAPFYINYGVFGGPPNLLKTFIHHSRMLHPKIAKLVDDWWAPQISVALSCFDLGLPVKALPMRYNYPNDTIADRMYPEELENVIFMHYLRLDQFQRDKIFKTKAYFDQFVSKEYSGSNEVFRKFVIGVTGGIYPFERKPDGLAMNV